jgi:hypothetical protein
VTVVPSPLIVYIVGGNRMIGFTKPISIRYYAKDPDVKISDSQSLDISCSWECRNLNKDTPC